MESITLDTGTGGGRPLVTFALFAYNQERFIREAVEGALSQTYSPLQIILSDDCSTDRTFEIMEEMVADYSGPHEILMNRNIRNLGIGGHVNRIMELVQGELVVAAAGDDISLPERTRLLWEAWAALGRPVASFCSPVITIDQDGREYGVRRYPAPKTPEDYVIRGLQGPLGASAAWHRLVFQQFGPLADCVIAEDMAIGFRALFLDGIIPLEQPLVRHRVHGGNISAASLSDFSEADARRLVIRSHERLSAAFQQFREDLKRPAVRERYSETEIRRFMRQCLIGKKRHELRSHTVSGMSHELFGAMFACLAAPVCLTEFFRAFLFLFLPKRLIYGTFVRGR